MLVRTECQYPDGKTLTGTGRELFETKECTDDEEATNWMLTAPAIYDSGSSQTYLGKNITREIRSIFPV
ncbi:hypothetical protein EXS73_01265 [Candidatus Pacearchaeota archaeon]|nr:hypothetical protein [Candidatus Pacearchaeota archaeon]